MTATTLTVADLHPFLPDLHPGKAQVVVDEILEAAAQFDEGQYAGIFLPAFSWALSAKAVLRDAAIRRYRQLPPGRTEDDGSGSALFLSAELDRLRALLAEANRVYSTGALPVGIFPDAPVLPSW